MILGTTRSGTKWITQVIGSSRLPTCYIVEPIYKMPPRMPFSSNLDHTAIEYNSSLKPNHPLVVKYKSLTDVNYDLNKIENSEKFLKYKEDNWIYCLVKEVHSLLATEGLIRLFNIPIILIVRDPVRVCDALFYRDGLETPYATIEGEHMLRNGFLKRFLPDSEAMIISRKKKISSIEYERHRIILEKVLYVALLRKLLVSLSELYENAHLVEYEKACKAPSLIFKKAANFMGLPWDDMSEEFLRRTMTGTPEDYRDSTSVYRNTSEELDRPLDFLSEEEAEKCYGMLKNLNIY